MEKKHTEKCARNSNVGIPAVQKDESYCDCDGYHTFTELYDHRIELWITLARLCRRQELKIGEMESQPFVWRSELHDDGSSFDGWFILGIGNFEGQQLTYHLPISRWSETDFARTLDKAPKWDKHTSEDVLTRLKTL